MEENKKVCRAHVEFTEDEFMALASLCAEWKMTIEEVVCKLITDKAVEIVNNNDISKDKESEETLEYSTPVHEFIDWEYSDEEKEKAIKEWRKLQEYLAPMLEGEIVWDAGIVVAMMYSLADNDLDEEFDVDIPDEKEIPMS